MLFMFSMLFDWMPHQIEQLCICIMVFFFTSVVIKWVSRIVDLLPFVK